MRVAIAPDKFAGTLTAAEAAQAMARGWSRVRPGDEVVACPMADGGEGTIEVVGAAVPDARRVVIDVADARGTATSAAWLRLPDGRALVESAQACGLSTLPATKRNPRWTTSYGVGQLLAAAVAGGASAVVVGLGGSATVDGGAGMATALGHRLLRGDGNGVKVGGEYLRRLHHVEPADPLGVPVLVAADVTNPLLGPEGAAAVFAPQKGAVPEDVPVLEQALARLADIVERDLDGGPWRDLPGAGAAGGLGFGLAAFCGGRLTGGAAAVAELIGLEDALQSADVVVTGEGSLDAQSTRGKVPAYVAERAGAHGARTLAIAGRLQPDAAGAYDQAVDLGPDGMARAAELVEQRAGELAAAV
ncbi:MAG: glycerate kinase [Egibacteraceae bacterium]